MTINEVLAAAANEFEQREPFRVDRDLRHGAGGMVFELLFETAKRLYGWTAIQHLQNVLRAELPHGQIQHWREADRATVVKVLREAAGVEPAPDVAVAAERARHEAAAARLIADLEADVAWQQKTYGGSTDPREKSALGRLVGMQDALRMVRQHLTPKGTDA